MKTVKKSDAELYPTALMFDERYSQQRGFHMLVAHALKAGQPLYYVRSACGTTLDCCASLGEAKKSHAQIADRSSRIYELRLTQLTEVPL